MTEEPTPFNEEVSLKLKSLGFDLRIKIVEYNNVRFSVEDVERALFRSTYRHPIYLQFFRKDADFTTPVERDLLVTPKLAQAAFVSSEGDGEPGCYEDPDWYLQGTSHFMGTVGERSPRRTHIYLMVGRPMEIDGAFVQVPPTQSEPRGVNSELPVHS